jgi:hypothetical protein
MGIFRSAKAQLEKLRFEWYLTIANDGGYCPCCDKWGKISSQGMSEARALTLLWIHRTPHEDGWVNVAKLAPKWILRAKNFSLMKHWGLIESDVNTTQNRRGSGRWRVTDKGRSFINETISVPAKVWLYNDEIQGWSTDHVYFRDCFGVRFNFDEIMQEKFNWARIKI